MRECISVVLSTPVCGNLLQQQQETVEAFGSSQNQAKEVWREELHEKGWDTEFLRDEQMRHGDPEGLELETDKCVCTTAKEMQS